jgi:hypothetical protein
VGDSRGDEGGKRGDSVGIERKKDKEMGKE